MRKNETIWHHLLYESLINRRFKFTQKGLAEQYGMSLSTVNQALKVPSQMGAVRKESRFFVLADYKKLLYYWASLRNLQRGSWMTRYEEGVREIEGLMPAGVIYGGYTAAGKLLGEPPGDYDKVYVYATEEGRKEIETRFGYPRAKERKKVMLANIVVLPMTEEMKQYGWVTTLPQTFVDIWNMSDWYSHEFTKRVEEKMDELLS